MMMRSSSEYEPGIFWPSGIIYAMFWARFVRRKKVILSIHEFARSKFRGRLDYRGSFGRGVRFETLLEVLR